MKAKLLAAAILSLADVHGTAEYKKLVGRSGTYQGYFTSNVVEWKD